MLGVLTTYPTWDLDGNIREFESQKVGSTKRHICFSVVTLSEKKRYILLIHFKNYTTIDREVH